MSAPTDLTPELLTQLKDDASFWNQLVAKRGTGAVFSYGGPLYSCFSVFDRIASALPALIAAAKERDQLRKEIALLTQQRDTILDGTLSDGDGDGGGAQVPVLRELTAVKKLEAEVERLRGLGLKAVDWAFAAYEDTHETFGGQFQDRLAKISSEIKMKP